MGTLGIAILNAMRDQGWLVVIDRKTVTTVNPEGKARVIPTSLLDLENERKLRYVLMAWIVVDDLAWPWPPDHHEKVHGEVPISE